MALQSRVIQLMATLEQEQKDAAQRTAEADRDRQLLEHLDAIRTRNGDDFDSEKIDSDYAIAFAEFGIDPERTHPDEAGRLLRKRPRALEIAMYLDDWAMLRRPGKDEKASESWRRLLATARATDPDPWRDELRKQIDGGKYDTVARLAANANAIAAQPARSLLLLARALKFTRD